MKTPTFFLFLMCLTACQKKQFATFQNSHQTQFNNEQKHFVINLPKPIENKVALLELNNISITAIKPLSTNNHLFKRRTFNQSAKNKNTIYDKTETINDKKKPLLKKLSTGKIEEDKLAKLSLILGISSVVGIFLVGGLAVFVGIAAIITGILSYKKTSKRGMSIWGIVLGSLTILTILIALILFISFLILLFGGQ